MARKGRVLGVPYDFTRPTVARVKSTLWNPSSDRIVVPRAYGVGWTVNFAALKRRAPYVFWAVAVLFSLRIARRIVELVWRGRKRS